MVITEESSYKLVTQSACYVMFKKTSSRVLSGFKTTRRGRVVLDSKKKRAASFLNGFKNIPGKGCVNRVHNNYAFVNVGN